MITEVAFVAIAVTDKERARKFYQETLGLKPTTSMHDGMWVEYEIGGDTYRGGLYSRVAPGARRYLGRVRSRRHRRDHREIEKGRRRICAREIRIAGLFYGCDPRSGWEPTPGSPAKTEIAH